MSSFWIWWRQLPMKIDPVVFEIGGLKVHYYGMMYIVACTVTYALVRHRLKHEGRFAISVDHVNNLMTYMIVGVIVGGRLGYVPEIVVYDENALYIYRNDAVYVNAKYPQKRPQTKRLHNYTSYVGMP